MSSFDKPGAKPKKDYPEYSLEAATKALIDAGINYDDVQFATAGYVYGDSTYGQRALYQLGLTQIPIMNVNNNCSTGSTALYIARQAVQGGMYDCALALGFEVMNPGPLKGNFPERTPPLDKGITIMAELAGIDKAPLNPQIFGNAGIEYCEKNGQSIESMDYIAAKNHTHSTRNPYAQFQMPTTVEDVKKARAIWKNITLLHCSPPSCGGACAIVASEAFVRKHKLEAQAVEIVAQQMATDSPLAFATGGAEKSCIEVAGADMTRRAADLAYKQAGITAKQVDVCELHDCFSANELITVDALGFVPSGKAGDWFLKDGGLHPDFQKTKTPGPVVNVSGGLISKGHPLGATGLAQCTELVWQLRGQAGKRQVPNAKIALQHNVGLGGAVVVGVYKRGFPEAGKPIDLAKKFGYNPADEYRGVTESDIAKVCSKTHAPIAHKPDMGEVARL